MNHKEDTLDSAVNLYERLREKSQEAIIASGIKHIPIDYCTWVIRKNEAFRTKEVVIQVNVGDKPTQLIVPFQGLELYARSETNTIKIARLISDRLLQRLSEHIAQVLGEQLMKECARSLVNFS